MFHSLGSLTPVLIGREMVQSNAVTFYIAAFWRSGVPFCKAELLALLTDPPSRRISTPILRLFGYHGLCFERQTLWIPVYLFQLIG